MARPAQLRRAASRNGDSNGVGAACALVLGLGLGLLASRASADTTLTADLSASIGPATHVASGSLYGVTEKLPADVNALIAPLKPNVFINPAADVQQPVGDAIVVAGRLAPIGARVTIRLADWFPRWPYAFTNMNDWLGKVGQTVTRKKDSGLDNYYGYEIWNEPDGTWTSSTPFNDFWKQTYAKLRELDPDGKVIGPSIAWYDGNYIKNFLSFAKANNCVPDIIAWHELAGANLTANLQNYRALEKQLGIGPLPISINEYSGKDRIDDEGQPGASAPIIAKFERFRVDSGCISYWDVPHPGRLGSLMASDTAKNGGWWFYKWYADMSGEMVTTIPPAPNDVTTLDGFANVDAASVTASVVFAGNNDGNIRIVVKGLSAAPFLGTTIHAVAERTPFANRTTAVSAAQMLSATDLPVMNDQITVMLNRTNATDGYRVVLTPVPGAGGGGAGGSGSGSAAASGSGGAAVGGRDSSGGAGMGAAGVGGSSGGKAGAVAVAGRSAVNGAGSGGGQFGSGQFGSAGAGTGSTSAPAGGAAASGVPLAAGGSHAAADGGMPARQQGCACSLSSTRVSGGAWPAVTLWLALTLAIRTQSRRVRLHRHSTRA